MNTSSKVLSLAELKTHFRDGMSILFGGFMSTGTPGGIVQALVASGVKDLTLIGNDTGRAGDGVGALIALHRVRKVIAGHIGTNPETGRQMLSGELEVELVPLGTLIERIRCGGSGLGGVLTTTGLGTIVEKDKVKLSFDGIEYLVERPIRADLAILRAHKADEEGNLIYRRTARNFNPVVAMAADYVVAEVDEVVPTGTFDPETVVTPGIFVDGLMLAEEMVHAR